MVFIVVVLCIVGSVLGILSLILLFEGLNYGEPLEILLGFGGIGLGLLIFISSLNMVHYIDGNPKTMSQDEYSVLCDDEVCIIRVEDETLTFETKKDYDMISSGEFDVLEIPELNSRGNEIDVRYEIKKK